MDLLDLVSKWMRRHVVYHVPVHSIWFPMLHHSLPSHRTNAKHRKVVYLCKWHREIREISLQKITPNGLEDFVFEIVVLIAVCPLFPAATPCCSKPTPMAIPLVIASEKSRLNRGGPLSIVDGRWMSAVTIANVTKQIATKSLRKVFPLMAVPVWKCHKSATKRLTDRYWLMRSMQWRSVFIIGFHVGEWRTSISWMILSKRYWHFRSTVRCYKSGVRCASYCEINFAATFRRCMTTPFRWSWNRK